MLEVAKEDVLKSLRLGNPWWDDAYEPEDDVYKHKRAYFGPFAELAFNWSIRRSVVLTEPRRVGKAIMLRQLIAQKLREG